jgi:hypothetical protein
LDREVFGGGSGLEKVSKSREIPIAILVNWGTLISHVYSNLDDFKIAMHLLEPCTYTPSKSNSNRAQSDNPKQIYREIRDYSTVKIIRKKKLFFRITRKKII